MPSRTRLPARVLATLALAANLAAQSAVTPAPATTPAAPGATDEVVQLDELEVRDARLSEYALPVSSSIGKGGIPIEENPQSITVVNRALLDDMGVVTLEEALRGVAGVQVGGYYSNWDYFRIRGFAADFNTYIDGLRGINGMGEETFGLEQVEVVKGPAALYGSGPIGGLVNLVSKRPTAEASTTIETTIGSYDYYQGTIDFNQPLNTDDTLLFRLNVLGRDEESNIDHVESERYFVAPSLTWKIGPRTSVTVLARYRDFQGTFDMPLPAIGTVLPNPNGHISSDRYVGFDGSNQGTELTRQIGYEFTHAFTENVKLTQNFRYDTLKQTWRDLMYPWAFPAPYDTIYLLPYNYEQKWDDTVVDTRLDAAIEGEQVTNNLTFGVDYFRNNTESLSNYGTGFVPLNLYNPDHSFPVLPAMTPLTAGESMTEITGLYLQDHIQLPARVTVTVGGRYDFAETGGRKETAFTPRAGGTWEFVPDAILYTSYSEAFNPQTGSNGESLSPETGDNIEVGLRNAFLGKKLTTTAALFQITRQNVATSNIILGGPSVTTGEQRSKGVELDARYTPVKGLELLAAYAYTDTEILEDNNLPVGARMTGVPLHTFNAWGKYTLQGGALRGLGFGLGASYYSEQEGDSTYADPFELPGYVLWNTALYYTRGRFSTQLNVANVFDNEYYSGAYDRLYVMPGDPRQIRLSASWTF